jgi:hypothetical protein
MFPRSLETVSNGAPMRTVNKQYLEQVLKLKV